MANSNAIRAGRAFVELFADSSKLVAGLRAAQAKVKAFGQGVKDIGMKIGTVGAAIATPIAPACWSQFSVFPLCALCGSGFFLRTCRKGMSGVAVASCRIVIALSVYD